MNAKQSRYVETTVTVHKARSDKGFAFGTALFDGIRGEVFIGSRAHGVKDGNGRWEKATPLTPAEGDILSAKICTVVDRGKKPFAAFWDIVHEAAQDHWGDEFVDDDFAVDETPCRYCDCWPCRCPQKY